MKKAIYSLALASVIALPTLVLAEEEVNVRADAEVRTGFSERLKGRIEDVRGRFEDRRGEDKGEMRRASSTASSTVRITVQQNVAKRLIAHASQMLKATLERLERIAERVQSRIDKVKAEGGDTAASEGFLAQAKVELSTARTKIDAFSSVTITADKMSETVHNLRSIAADAKEHLGQARAYLVKAISSLKPGRTEVKVKADVSASASVNSQ